MLIQLYLHKMGYPKGVLIHFVSRVNKIRIQTSYYSWTRILLTLLKKYINTPSEFPLVDWEM